MLSIVIRVWCFYCCLYTFLTVFVDLTVSIKAGCQVFVFHHVGCKQRPTRHLLFFLFFFYHKGPNQNTTDALASGFWLPRYPRNGGERKTQAVECWRQVMAHLDRLVFVFFLPTFSRLAVRDRRESERAQHYITPSIREDAERHKRLRRKDAIQLTNEERRWLSLKSVNLIRLADSRSR